MKILFVTKNYEHFNDMDLYKIKSFMDVSDVDYYGPGIVSREQLKKGLKQYWDKNGGYDAIILDYSLAMLRSEHLDIRLAYHWHRYYISDYSVFEAVRYVDRIVDDIKTMNVPKILFFSFDTVSLSEEWEKNIVELIEGGFYFLGSGADFTPEIEETEHTRNIGWTNRFYRFCQKYKNKIISTPAGVACNHEIFKKPLEKRKYDITVPGNLDETFYPGRGKIVELIKDTNYKYYDGYKNRALGYMKDAEKINRKIYFNKQDMALDVSLIQPCPYLNTKVNRESIVTWREEYNNALRNTKIGYADGSIGLRLVRKYIEIPARGTLLLCEDIPSLEPYGFVNWVNMVIVSPENILEVCDYLFKHPEQMQKIASEGQRMVYEKHSPIVYAKAVISAIKAIEKGSFKGAHWEKGDFVLD